MSCGNSDILALIDYYQNGTDLSSRNWDNYNFYDWWNAAENGASPPSRTICATFTQADILSITLAVLGTFTTPSEYLGFNRDFYYLYLKAIGSEDPSPVFTNECLYDLYQVFTVNSFTGLLDDYPNAAAAYSIRLLKSDYSGALVRIRKASDNSEDDFYPDSNNELSLSSTNLGGTTLSSFIGSENGFIVTWYDQSGNSNNATQATAANQPKIINAGALITDNSKPAFEFNGVTNSRELTVLSALTFNQDSSIISVASSNDNTSEQTIYNLQINAINRQFALGYNRDGTNRIGSSIRLSDLSFVNSGDSIADMTQRLYSQVGICSTSTNTLYIDSVAATNTYRPRAATGNSLGGRSGAFFLNGYLQEVILWESDKSSDLTGIETNVNSFFSIY